MLTLAGTKNVFFIAAFLLLIVLGYVVVRSLTGIVVSAKTGAQTGRKSLYYFLILFGFIAIIIIIPQVREGLFVTGYILLRMGILIILGLVSFLSKYLL